MTFLHSSNRYRLALSLATCSTLVLATAFRWDWYSNHPPANRVPASQVDRLRGDRVHQRPQLIAATFVLGAIASTPLAAQKWSHMPPGNYTLEMRDSTVESPYQGMVFRFVSGGDLVWERGGLAIQMMEWSLRGDTLTLRQSDGCVLNPIGVYQMESRPGGGFSLLVLNDGCDPRALAMSSTYLRPAPE